MTRGMQKPTWSRQPWRPIQRFYQMTLLLSLLFPTTKPVPWFNDFSNSPGEDCPGFQMDICGVCAGDGSSCELFSGTLFLSVLSVGYHKILDIPIGAQRIKLQETQKTRNYLALRTATGKSVINGDWVIDRPGQVYSAGTEFTYKRPNEISSRTGESITAPGPTNQELHLFVLYQQPSPTVYYEYILPRDPTIIAHSDTYSDSSVFPHESHGLFAGRDISNTKNSMGGLHPNHVPLDPMTSEPLPLYSWVAMTKTPCSVTCGTGIRQVLFSCIERATQTTVSGDLCSHTHHPGPQGEDCQSLPCPAFWDVGEWSECSKTCGPGFQYRQVICRQTRGHHVNSTITVATSLCDNTEMPETTTMCQLKICSEWQIRSEWTECSVPCGVGQRSREVVCMDNLGDVVTDEECNMALRPQDLQNCDKGVCASSWFFSLWSDRVRICNVLVFGIFRSTYNAAFCVSLQCSADCAEGSRSRSVVCMMSQNNSLPLDNCNDKEKPDELMPCDLGPCTDQLEWYTGPWGQCSSECGNGTQSRGVVCILQSNGQLEVNSDDTCSHLSRPANTQTCHLKSCGAQWYMTAWSSCSRSCEGGFRVREVRCLRDDQTISNDCDLAHEPARKEECNTHTCMPHIDESCKDMYYNCVVVVQARLCVYSYYRTTCCASCSRVIHRDTLSRIR
ncbi:thrombospondin type-1 domain-containing protein 4-like isoform X2 [Xyrauchen texanus]|uniref:thrombospondin type-1 domain-containing protein 4-like isoform X2 n=1 Tax=Xyrauchen texanus TaxID=154827 RepID=UPI00224206AD|nr:thrombospondin type-1 domain-containing protein 4-like isoform X2 [Xyrauchen texanus]